MAANEPEPGLPEDARLTSLDERLRRARRVEEERTGSRHFDAKRFTQTPAWRVLSVLIGYPAGSAMIGYAADQLFGTVNLWVPMLFVGFLVAFWEIWKISTRGPRGS
ncbi:MAG: AtpZ/AtpI family protein [Sphingosinicella sp.]